MPSSSVNRTAKTFKNLVIKQEEMTSDRQTTSMQPKHASSGTQKSCPQLPNELPPQANTGDVTKCVACDDVISDRFYLQVSERQWHVHCLKCCECKQVLDTNATNTCFTREGNIYCKEDYARFVPPLLRFTASTVLLPF